MNKILVIGSVALDTIETPSGVSKEILGGSATYFSISASFFSKVALVATVGEDFPDKYRTLIRSFDVDTRGLEVKKGRTFRWEGSYMKDMNCAETIDTQLNVFADFKPRLPEEYKKCKYIFLANIDPDLQLFLLKGSDDYKFIGCDSMNHWITSKGKTLKKLINKVSAIFLNDAEARLLSGESNVIKAGKYLLSLGPRLAIVKRGEYGSILFSRDNTPFVSPAYPLETVCDPTGAGDTFAGGFVGYLAQTDSLDQATLRKALLYGSTMASFTVEDFSVNKLLNIKRKNVEARYKAFRKLIAA